MKKDTQTVLTVGVLGVVAYYLFFAKPASAAAPGAGGLHPYSGMPGMLPYGTSAYGAPRYQTPYQYATQNPYGVNYPFTRSPIPFTLGPSAAGPKAGGGGPSGGGAGGGPSGGGAGGGPSGGIAPPGGGYTISQPPTTYDPCMPPMPGCPGYTDSEDPCDPTSTAYSPSQCQPDSGDPCDPSSVQYNPAVCAELQGASGGYDSTQYDPSQQPY